VSRSLRSGSLLLAAALTTACAERETPRPSGTAVRSPEQAVSPLAGGRFSLMQAKLNMPPLPEAGTVSEGQVAIPLNTPDPRYAEYFADIKRRIEDKWSYPKEASRKGQSGQGELLFVVRKDGSVRKVEIGGGETIPISINFTYTLGPGLLPSPSPSP
jgi:outer membrane biosynthesis protein TonB